MKDSIKNRKKKLLALCLSALMLSSVTAIAACTDGSTDSSSPSSSSAAASEEKDTGLIKNANFNFVSNKNVFNTSVNGWTLDKDSLTGDNKALASKAASGVLDLDEDAWKDLTGSYYTNPDQVKTLTEAEAEAVWENLTTRDKLLYYKTWKEKDENKNLTISKELEFYESFNISYNDIPQIERFATHHTAAEIDAIEEDTGKDFNDYKVLMIHNQYPDVSSSNTYKNEGTAQKFTSTSTVTVKAGSAAEFSVWVRTQDLQSAATNGSVQEAVDKGAYISITHSVGGKALDAYKVENINTETMDAGELSNGWKQYTFLLQGSSYTDTTFSIVLGLGQGGLTDRGEWVNGYAFFDDIQCETISNATFSSRVDELGIDANDVVGFEHEGDEKIVNVAKAENADRDCFALDFYSDFSSASILSEAAAKPTTSKIAGADVSSLNAAWLNGGIDGTYDVNSVFADTAAIGAATANNNYLASAYSNYFENDTFAKDKEILLMLSANGAAWTVDSNHSFEFKNPVTGEAVDYLAISFFVKTSDMQGYTGAGITLVDGINKTSFASLDTSNIEAVKIDDNEDVYQGWQQCFFFVKNDSEKPETTFTLSFNFGPTSITKDMTVDNFHPGFAAFTDFTVYAMTEDEYTAAKSGTYSKIVSVKGDKKDESKSTSGFDATAGVPVNAIENGLAHPQNYKGVYSDSAYITGELNASTSYNKHENAGLISQEHFTAEDGYFATSDAKWLTGIKALAPTAQSAQEVWNTVFGSDCIRPLLIWNDASNQGKAYGYIGKSTSIAANTYTAVSVRVKVSAGAKANIHLIDTDQEKFDTNLSIGRNLTYWYDEDGNICTGNPNEKATQVAFKLQSNGLYKANKNWDGYKAEYADLWFANLDAYTKTDANGNKLVAEGGASHDYSDYWNNEGLDGIAYYYNKTTKKYYADRALTIPVSNLADVTQLAPRYEAIDANGQQFTATVTDTQGEWKIVTFYIHTGDTAKNYRLEVWSGDRNGAGNPDNSYVIFDYSPVDAQANFTTLLDSLKDEVADEDKFEGVFSYFDTAHYLRYNANLDEKGHGNLYKENYPTIPEEGSIAYLKYEKGDEYTIFADYQYSEKAVEAAPVEDEDTSSDSSAEPEADTNIWLLISSLAIAIILVFAVVSILVRKIVKKVRKNRAAQASLKNKKSK